MNIAQAFLRKFPKPTNNLLCPNTPTTIFCHKSTKGQSTSSSGTSSDSDEKTPKKTSSDEAVSKLNMLLQQMVNEDVPRSESTIKLAKPGGKQIKEKAIGQSVKAESAEKQVIKAVKTVAQSLGGDAKQTESELLQKLLNPVETNQGTTTNLSDIIKGMKIDREPKPTEQSKADQVRTFLNQVSSKSKSIEQTTAQRRSVVQQIREEIVADKIDLFGSKRLKIFTDKTSLKESPQLNTWQKLHEKELKLAVTHPPANYFEQMILWTEQGKLWKFPINNEIGFDEEAKVYFANHVFLEEHLEPWCPAKGPVRHFMELVCVGLSKNSYLTVEAKKEHIEWYRKYFEDKKELLQEVGAIPVESIREKPKNIESE